MKITLTGIIVFVALVAGFLLWMGPFPDVGHASYAIRRGADRGWLDCAMLFIAGAATACFSDKQYGLFPPQSLRWLFVLFGALIMLISGIWMHSLKKAWRDAKEASLRHELISRGDPQV